MSPLDAASVRRTLLLALGAVIGIGLAATGLLGSQAPGHQPLPPSAVALVNGEVIRKDDYQRALSALAQDRRDGLNDGDRRLVLDRLIDEELLVQRGVQLGFMRKDARVRKDLTAAVIDSVVFEPQDVQPKDNELQAFYDEHREFFTGPGRLRVWQIWCRVTDTDGKHPLDRAQQAANRLRAGEPFATVRAALGDPELAPLPDVLLPAEKLADYLGPTALRTALTLEVGAVSDPIRSSTGYHVLQVAERQAAEAPPLESIRPQVEVEFHRRAADRALRAYLDDLRRRALVEVAPALP